MKKTHGNKSRLILLLPLALLLFGCTGFLNASEIKNQDAMVSAAFQNATKLLEFQDREHLASFNPNYATYSAIMGDACNKLNDLDKGGQQTSKGTSLICQNKKGIDDCFFYLEKIKAELKSNSNATINIDNADVLCRDLRSLGLDAQLTSEESKYNSYMVWLKAEPDIDKQWHNVQWQMQNYTYNSVGGSISDYYNGVKGSMASTSASLDQIKQDCASESNFSASATAVAVCSKIDTYISDMAKSDTVMKDVFTFVSKFAVGTITVDEGLVTECRNANQELTGLYSLQLYKDNPGSGNSSGFTTACDSLEQLSQASSSLGFPIVFENGKLSTNTKINLLKAKTVYIQTDTVLGSGVLLASDANGYYVLTNAHVALKYDKTTATSYLPNYVRVQFYDGHIGYASKLRFNKENYDLVILYVPSSVFKYPTASFSETDYPSAGTQVVAVGNPYGLEFSVSEGTVSAVRDASCLMNYCYGKVIQTDTAINPGNSGGGLWDFDSGDLLGINSFGLTQAEGLNFAISMVQYATIKDTFVEYNLG